MSKLKFSSAFFDDVDWTAVSIVSGIVIFGMVLRLCGVNYGLPYLYDFDERIFVDRAYYMLGNRDLNPNWFGAPASITIYLLCIAYGMIFAGGLVLGVFDNPGEFKDLYFSDPTAFYLSGRLISVFFGTLSIVAVYFIGKRLIDRRGGYIAAFATAVLPLTVAFSKVIRMDAPMVFFILVAFWFCLDILKTNSWRGYILSGAAIGLGISCKYPSVFFSPMVLLAALLYFWREKSSSLPSLLVKLAAAAVASIVACFLTAPFVFLDFQQTLQDVVFESRSEHLGATGGGLIPNLIWYFGTVLRSELGILGLLLACAAIVYALVRRRADLGLAAFAIAIFLLPLSALSLRWDRWLLPVFPFFALFLADAIAAISNAIAVRQSNRKLGTYLSLGLSALVLLAPFSTSLMESKASLGTETRTLATEWIAQEVPEGSRILVELRAPQLSLSTYDIFQVGEEGDLAEISPDAQDADRFIPQFRFIGSLEDADSIGEANIDYVITAGADSRYRKERESFEAAGKDTTELDRTIAVYDAIAEASEEVYRVAPEHGVNRGPEIAIYALK